MVSVLGFVRNQGRYPIVGKRSLTEILAMAGGIIPDGADLITLIRSDGDKYVKEVIDVLEMIRSGDLTRDLSIRNDDLIYVERAPRFYIYGEVQRAGAYRLERNMTVMQALSVGGGLTQRGTERGLRIQRRDTEGNLQILSVKSSDLVEPDDVIYIKESLF
jgi:polysaccharide export outer membrane protein